MGQRIIYGYGYWDDYGYGYESILQLNLLLLNHLILQLHQDLQWQLLQLVQLLILQQQIH